MCGCKPKSGDGKANSNRDRRAGTQPDAGLLCAHRQEVPAKVAELMHDGDTVTVGGSMTLEQCGVMELLRSGRYHFLDRTAPG